MHYKKNYWIGKSDWKDNGNYFQGQYNEIANQVQKTCWMCYKIYDFPFSKEILAAHMNTNKSIYKSRQYKWIEKIRMIEGLLNKLEDDLLMVKDHSYDNKVMEIQRKIRAFKNNLELSNIWTGKEKE